MDVKTALLNGYLCEDVYMVQPEGFADPKHPSKVCKLQRFIYGLKQTSRSWNKRFDEEIKKIDLGEATYIIGIKITRDRSKRLIALSQSVYFDKILKKFKMEISKRGSIMYAVRYTRLDVAFAQNLCSRFQQNPSDIHWTVVKAILKYLRNTKEMTDKDDTKSQSRYVFVPNGGAVDWKSVKQSTTTVPMEMPRDNAPAIAISNDPGINKGARHHQRKYHYVREVIQAGEIVLKKVHTMTT
ncbi:retrotransposon protein, putative, ty1-copia subclass [Tanacetum coccineum]